MIPRKLEMDEDLRTYSNLCQLKIEQEVGTKIVSLKKKKLNNLSTKFCVCLFVYLYQSYAITAVWVSLIGGG